MVLPINVNALGHTVSIYKLQMSYHSRGSPKPSSVIEQTLIFQIATHNLPTTRTFKSHQTRVNLQINISKPRSKRGYRARVDSDLDERSTL